MTNFQIPKPDTFDGLTQLAQISLPRNGLLCTYWNKYTEEVLYELQRGDTTIWYKMPDEEIGTSCASILGIPLTLLQVFDLKIYEGTPPHQSVYMADAKIKGDFLRCVWSDYAKSDMAVQCEFVY
jgi:hypothetical protein